MDDRILGERAGAAKALCARDVHLSYGRTVALAGASLDIVAGEVVALSGRSGSGKSSLLYCLAGMQRPTSGSVRYGDQDLTTLRGTSLSALRRRDFGFVFQFGELVPELTLAENVSLPLRLNGARGATVRTQVSALLDELGIADVAEMRPTEVSGGQAQRAAVARALVHRPRVVFADEPTGSLDSDNGALVLSKFVALARDNGTAVVLVTHDPDVAAIADRELRVVDGRTASAVRI